MQGRGDAGRWASFIGNDMAFGFPARFTESRTFHLRRDELFAVVKSALEDLGWSHKVLWGTEFVASVNNSPFTFREEFKVKILPDGAIQAESKCVSGGLYHMPQIFDFGANRKNVEAFFAQVERAANRRSPPDNL
jgi:hypothetical protein